MGFSVVIPTYNGSAFIAGAISSVFAQTLLPREIIVVDDCSMDSTCDVVGSLAADSPVPLRLLRLAENSGGPARPINVGVAAASGEYIAVLDHDDMFAPTRLQRHAAAFEAFPEASAAVSWCADLRNTELAFQAPSMIRDVLSAAEPRGAFQYISSASFFRLLAWGNFTFGYPGFSFRRSDWREKGGVDESLRIASDYELLLWLADRGPAALTPSVGYWRRFHDGNLTRDTLTLLREVDDVRIKAFRQRAKRFPNEELGRALALAVLSDLRDVRRRWRYHECLRRSWRVLGMRGTRLAVLRWHVELSLHLVLRTARNVLTTLAAGLQGRGAYSDRLKRLRQVMSR